MRFRRFRTRRVLALLGALVLVVAAVGIGLLLTRPATVRGGCR